MSTRIGWQSPLAWVKTLVIVAVVWAVIFFATGSSGAATGVVIALVLFGAVGALYT